MAEANISDNDRPRVRYGMIDAARAVAVINMIAYHLCYDIFCVFGVWKDFWLHPAAAFWEQCICVGFIIISGISLHFSRRGFFRGIVVLLCGAAVTAATLIFIRDQLILFGVLSFLGCAMLLTYALRKPLDRLDPLPGIIILLLLFMLCYGVPFGYIGIFKIPLIYLPEGLYKIGWLAPLGFPPEGFFSADYFPFIPWIFLYQAGYMLWRIIKAKGLDRYLYREIRPLGFIGRHSLVIYLLHQPVLYGICLLIFR